MKENNLVIKTYFVSQKNSEYVLLEDMEYDKLKIYIDKINLDILQILADNYGFKIIKL